MTQIKKIEGFDGYFITDTGKVIKEEGNEIKPHKTNKGYLRVNLRKDGKSVHKLIHRLLAEAFIPNPENKPCIDHIDGNPLNNSLDNLRWCTQKENLNNPIALKRISEKIKGEKHPFYGKHLNLKHKSKISEKLLNRHDVSKPVKQYTKDGAFVAEYPSIMEASRQTGISNDTISLCCNKKPNRKTAGGYKWEYAA